MFYQTPKRWMLSIAVLMVIVLSVLSISQSHAQTAKPAADLILTNTTNAPMRVDVETIGRDRKRIGGFKIPASGKPSKRSLGLLQPGETRFFINSLPEGNNFVVLQPQVDDGNVKPRQFEYKIKIKDGRLNEAVVSRTVGVSYFPGAKLKEANRPTVNSSKPDLARARAIVAQLQAMKTRAAAYGLDRSCKTLGPEAADYSKQAKRLIKSMDAATRLMESSSSLSSPHRRKLTWFLAAHYLLNHRLYKARELLDPADLPSPDLCALAAINSRPKQIDDHLKEATRLLGVVKTQISDVRKGNRDLASRFRSGFDAFAANWQRRVNKNSNQIDGLRHVWAPLRNLQKLYPASSQLHDAALRTLGTLNAPALAIPKNNEVGFLSGDADKYHRYFQSLSVRWQVCLWGDGNYARAVEAWKIADEPGEALKSYRIALASGRKAVREDQVKIDQALKNLPDIERDLAAEKQRLARLRKKVNACQAPVTADKDPGSANDPRNTKDKSDKPDPVTEPKGVTPRVVDKPSGKDKQCGAGQDTVQNATATYVICGPPAGIFSSCRTVHCQTSLQLETFLQSHPDHKIKQKMDCPTPKSKPAADCPPPAKQVEQDKPDPDKPEPVKPKLANLCDKVSGPFERGRTAYKANQLDVAREELEAARRLLNEAGDPNACPNLRQRIAKGLQLNRLKRVSIRADQVLATCNADELKAVADNLRGINHAVADRIRARLAQAKGIRAMFNQARADYRAGVPEKAKPALIRVRKDINRADTPICGDIASRTDDGLDKIAKLARIRDMVRKAIRGCSVDWMSKARAAYGNQDNPYFGRLIKGMNRATPNCRRKLAREKYASAARYCNNNIPRGYRLKRIKKDRAGDYHCEFRAPRRRARRVTRRQVRRRPTRFVMPRIIPPPPRWTPRRRLPRRAKRCRNTVGDMFSSKVVCD